MRERRAVVPHQIFVTIRAELRPGRAGEVASLLDALRKIVEQDGGPLADLPGVHFARVFVLPGDPELDVPDTLIYSSEIDAPERAHLNALTTPESGLLGQLFAQCDSFPEGGSERARVRWARRNRVRAAARYVHQVGRSTPQIRNEARLRAEIQTFLDDPRRDWSRHTRSEVHRAVRQFVAGRLDLTPLLAPPPPLPLGFRIRELAHAIALPALLLPLAPLLLIGAPVWLLLVRRLESRDVPETQRPTPEHVAELARDEDHGVVNPFTAYGQVKPGFVRRVTIGVALRGLDYACRHVFTRDNLAGIRSIHFARWLLLDGGRRVVFASNYDDSQESYMNDFIDRLAWGVNLVFSNGRGYPPTRWLIKDGARHEDLYKRYLRRHQISSVWFSAYPTLSAHNLDDNSRLRAGLSGELNDQEAEQWLALL
jgi:hypothetical protein